MILEVGIVLAVALASAGAYRFYRVSWRPWEQHRKPIGELQDGDLVKVVGRAVAVDPPHPAALSGRSAIYSQVAFYRAGDRGEMRLVHLAVEGSQLLIDDGTGRALVRLDGAAVELSLDNRARFDGDVSRRGRELRDQLRLGPIDAVEEAIIIPGDRIAVVGRVRLEPSLAAGARPATYRDLPVLPVLHPDPDLGLRLSDRPLIIDRPSRAPATS